jgi:hypothetical protein
MVPTHEPFLLSECHDGFEASGHNNSRVLHHAYGVAIVNAPEQGCSYKGRDKFGKSRSKANSSFTSKRKFLDDQGLYLYPLALAGPELYVLTSGPIQCQLTLPPTCV